MKANEYVSSGEHLPEILKDFHDQKDFFKAIYHNCGETSDVLKDVNWMQAHVLTIDVFLHWAGLHGYKLQKSRAKGVEFYDIEETINAFKAKQSELFSEMLKDRLNARPEPPKE